VFGVGGNQNFEEVFASFCTRKDANEQGFEGAQNPLEVFASFCTRKDASQQGFEGAQNPLEVFALQYAPCGTTSTSQAHSWRAILGCSHSSRDASLPSWTIVKMNVVVLTRKLHQPKIHPIFEVSQIQLAKIPTRCN
jgi:hypothetical protein